ncbi:hint-domain-containing protein [Cladochytrium replicatum]|nr:hint-domain-containing protein [Cladochytrium replicatum]
MPSVNADLPAYAPPRPNPPPSTANASNPTTQNASVRLDSFGLEAEFKKMGEDGPFYTNVRVIPPFQGPRKPALIVCAIDVSYSMNDAVFLDGQSTGLSILDLVKHSVNTIIEMLGPEDKIAFVPFTNAVVDEMSPMLMTPEGKDEVRARLAALRPLESTNIGDALIKSVQFASSEPAYENVAILLLSDGVSNAGPSVEFELEKIAVKRQERQFKGIIHSFAYGYSTDTKLMRQIGETGKGIFAFISDASMAGNVIIHAVSSVLSFALQPVLKLEAAGGWSSVVDMGELMYGQTRTHALSIPRNNPLKATLTTFDGQVIKSVEFIETAGDDEFWFHHARYLTIKELDVIAARLERQEKLKALIATLEALPAEHEQLEALVNDLAGEVILGLQDGETWSKWGERYLLSFRRSHELQVCSNFKDKSLKPYGGPMFQDFRNKGTELFKNLPPPIPSLLNAPAYSSSSSNGTTRYVAAPTVQMGQLYDEYGPCYEGEGTVSMADGKTKRVKDLVKGDVLAHGAVVECVVYTPLKVPVDIVMLNGVKVSPYHPAKNPAETQWSFPITIAGTKAKMSLDAFYNLVVKDAEHKVTINGYDFATLGHGRMDDEVLRHGYLGTGRVIEDLKRIKGWKEGRVVVERVVRDSEGLIVQMK